MIELLRGSFPAGVTEGNEARSVLLKATADAVLVAKPELVPEWTKQGQFRIEFSVRLAENQRAVVVQQGGADALGRVWAVAVARQDTREKVSVQFF